MPVACFPAVGESFDRKTHPVRMWIAIKYPSPLQPLPRAEGLLYGVDNGIRRGRPSEARK